MVEKIILGILRKVVGALSQEVKNLMKSSYLRLKESAAKTDNEWDDLFVMILGVLLDLE